jgi:hypothetical protein
MLPDSILHEQIKIIGMVVGPIHGDDKLGLRIDLTLVGLGSDRQQRDKEEEGDDLQGLEQHHAERIEWLLSRVEAEVIEHRGAPTPAPHASR